MFCGTPENANSAHTIYSFLYIPTEQINTYRKIKMGRWESASQFAEIIRISCSLYWLVKGDVNISFVQIDYCQ